MEFVHDDGSECGVGALAQRDIGEDFGGAANDGRILVHTGVAGDHPDVPGAEYLAQGKELFGDQGLDGRCVIAALPGGHGIEMRRHGHQGFP